MCLKHLDEHLMNGRGHYCPIFHCIVLLEQCFSSVGNLPPREHLTMSETVWFSQSVRVLCHLVGHWECWRVPSMHRTDGTARTQLKKPGGLRNPAQERENTGQEKHRSRN